MNAAPITKTQVRSAFTSAIKTVTVRFVRYTLTFDDLLNRIAFDSLSIRVFSILVNIVEFEWKAASRVLNKAMVNGQIENVGESDCQFSVKLFNHHAGSRLETFTYSEWNFCSNLCFFEDNLKDVLRSSVDRKVDLVVADSLIWFDCHQVERICLWFLLRYD